MTRLSEHRRGSGAERLAGAFGAVLALSFLGTLLALIVVASGNLPRLGTTGGALAPEVLGPPVAVQPAPQGEPFELFSPLDPPGIELAAPAPSTFSAPGTSTPSVVADGGAGSSGGAVGASEGRQDRKPKKPRKKPPGAPGTGPATQPSGPGKGRGGPGPPAHAGPKQGSGPGAPAHAGPKPKGSNQGSAVGRGSGSAKNKGRGNGQQTGGRGRK